MEEQLNEAPQGDSVYDAANAIEALLKGSGTDADPMGEAAPVQQTQPQAEAQPAQEVRAPASEEVQAPASEVTAPPAVEQPKAAPAISPEIEQIRSEASKTQQEAAAARDTFLNALNTLVPQFEAAIKGEFADIRTQDDLLALGATDPERYNRAVIAFTKLNNANQARQQAEAAVQRDKEAAEQTRRAGEVQKLVKAIPELGNPETGPAYEAKLRAFAQSKGITPKPNWGAEEVLLLNEAMKAADLPTKLAEAQAKAAKAPPVQQPGTTRDASSKDEKANEDFARLQKNPGDLHAAAAVFRNFL